MINLNDILKSWKSSSGVNSIQTIQSFLDERKEKTKVKIEKIDFQKCSGWLYDKEAGYIRRNNMSFFAIAGIQKYKDNKFENQPIILQPEIGFLGIICKKINGILHFLMQAKIEPGNINYVQISPTIQATKSNFTQKHGGAKPLYLDYFLSVETSNILSDQIQSEQSSRFYGKRNRNIIVYVEDDVPVSPNHIWMTLGQIKHFLKINNAVNMDTRTVLSSIPFFDFDEKFLNVSQHNDVFNYLSDYKMFDYVQPEIVDIFSLKNWEFDGKEYRSLDPYFPFKIVFCNILIEGREVRQWCQPLFEATKSAFFGLAVRKKEGHLQLLLKAKGEMGCKDGIELGPTVQSDLNDEDVDSIMIKFLKTMENEKCVLSDVMQSEEGGRFYHESNRNVIIQVDGNDFERLPKGYFWVNLENVQYYLLINNIVNIQLRSLISLLDYETVYGEEEKC